MNLPTYYTLLDFTEGLAGRITSAFKSSKDAEPPVHSLRKRMLKEAAKRYDNIVGRFDTPNKVASRELEVPANEREEKAALKLGAIKREDGQWIVPDHLALDKFERWWPMVPEDLRDETPRMLLTRDGRKIETRLAINDVVRGDDSTATSLLYGGFPAVAITAFILFHLHAGLGILAMLLFIPFTWAMSNAEKAGEAFKCLATLGLVPLALAMGVAKAEAGAGLLMGMGPLMIGGALFAVPVIAMAFAFIATAMDDNREASVIGGTFGKFKTIMQWSMVYTGAFILMLVLPGFAKPAVPFLVAAMYPMVYFNGNFMKRHKELKIVGGNLGYNLGTQGALATAHVLPKKRQAERALKDKSPKFVLGTATGYLTAKQLPDAPDAGKAMILTDHDLSRHLFIFGATGSGKTESAAKQVAVQWVTNGCGGMLVLDGKGALPGDIKELIDVMIAPGVNFAPFQGLDGHGIALAINAVASASEEDGGHNIWVRGASQFCTRAFNIFDALHNHEKAYKQHATDVAARKELEIDALTVEIAKLEMLGEDTAEALAKLQGAQKSYNLWATARDEPRKWKWNVDTALKVIGMINTVERDNQGNEIPGKLFRDSVAWLGWGVDPAVRARNPKEYHPEIGTNGLLDGAISYVYNDWIAGLEPQQRSSFYLNVMDRVLPLATDPYMVGSEGAHWKTLETGVDAGVCLYGQSVGVFLPKEKHQGSGHLVSALIKQRIYDAVSLRGGDNRNWRENGETPLLLLMDECQDLVDSAERDLLPKARSLGLRGVFMTQEFESLINKFGNEHKARQFVDTFQSFMKLTTESKATQDYVDSRLGVAPLIKFQMPTKGLDFKGAVKMVADSPLNDPEHPGYAVMRKIEKEAGISFYHHSPTGGANKMWAGARMVNPEDMDVARGFMAPGGGMLEEGPLLTPSEHGALIRTGVAVLYLKRAGEPRIDVAEVHMVTDEQMEAAIAAKRARDEGRKAAVAVPKKVAVAV